MQPPWLLARRHHQQARNNLQRLLTQLREDLQGMHACWWLLDGLHLRDLRHLRLRSASLSRRPSNPGRSGAFSAAEQHTPDGSRGRLTHFRRAQSPNSAGPVTYENKVVKVRCALFSSAALRASRAHFLQLFFLRPPLKIGIHSAHENRIIE